MISWACCQTLCDWRRTAEYQRCADPGILGPRQAFSTASVLPATVIILKIGLVPRPALAIVVRAKKRQMQVEFCNIIRVLLVRREATYILLFRHEISELRRPFAAKLCTLLGSVFNFIIPFRNFGGPSPKNLGGKKMQNLAWFWTPSNLDGK